jgi:hypothetical protein
LLLSWVNGAGGDKGVRGVGDVCHWKSRILGVKTTQGVLLEADKNDIGGFEFRLAAWNGERRFVFLAPGEDGMDSSTEVHINGASPVRSREGDLHI